MLLLIIFKGLCKNKFIEVYYYKNIYCSLTTGEVILVLIDNSLTFSIGKIFQVLTIHSVVIRPPFKLCSRASFNIRSSLMLIQSQKN